MNPGRELDAIIAEKIFKDVVFRNEGEGWSIGEPDYYDSYGELILWNPLQAYSTDITETFKIVEKICNDFDKRHRLKTLRRVKTLEYYSEFENNIYKGDPHTFGSGWQW